MAISRRLVIGISAACIVMAGVAFEFLAPHTSQPNHLEQTASQARSQPNNAERHSSSQFASVNPLANLALSSLKEMIERPLFNKTRAPKPPHVMAEQPPDEPQEQQGAPEDFTLLGVVIASGGKTALLRLNKTNEVVRLKDGQMFTDWLVTEIGPRYIVIKKADQVFTIKLFGPRPPNSVPPPGSNGNEEGSNAQVSDNG
jgi:hypothetical protein